MGELAGKWLCGYERAYRLQDKMSPIANLWLYIYILSTSFENINTW